MRQNISPELTTATTQAHLVEIFSAIQGEGLNIGTRQIFIRFAGCDLRCHYCDSAHTWKPKSSCQIEQTPGQRDFGQHPNPVTLPQLLTWVAQQDQPGLHDSISLTGGEPLLQADFLAQFLPVVRQQTSLPIYLETGGHQPEALQKVLPYLDSIGMDLKLPSVSGETHWQAHYDFLQACEATGVEVFTKLIISGQTEQADLQQAAALIAEVNPAIQTFLQPVTPLGQCDSPVERLRQRMTAPTPDQVLQWQAQMKQTLKTVRVIPQTHKFIQQL